MSTTPQDLENLLQELGDFTIAVSTLTTTCAIIVSELNIPPAELDTLGNLFVGIEELVKQKDLQIAQKIEKMIRDHYKK